MWSVVEKTMIGLYLATFVLARTFPLSKYFFYNHKVATINIAMNTKYNVPLIPVYAFSL